LKGIGAYTASAVASFCFNLPHAVVDGNVLRVLSRYFGIHLAIDSTEGKKIFTQLAQECLIKISPVNTTNPSWILEPPFASPYRCANTAR
jgi:A/G-specific adenine glycosylase